ncbi:SDR family oxidoreductase [Akkermansiaceae bacterium]|nr:SDR family oxidoreductase [Akkermansiaceae bacterium]
MTNMKVVVTGASGMLGGALVREYARHPLDVAAVIGQASLSLTNVRCHSCDLNSPESIIEILEQEHPDFVVHSAAITNHQYCEDHPKQARAVNAYSTARIAEYCKENGAYLIYVSSEAVYGESENLHGETDRCHPVSVYAKTKLEGEMLARESGADVAILRTTIVGFSPKRDRSLVDWAINEFDKGKEIMGFDDVIFSPVSVQDFARITVEFFKTRMQGVWNIGTSDPLSKYRFLKLLAKACHYDQKKVIKGSVKGAGLTGRHCLQAALDIGKLTTRFPKQVRTAEETIKAMCDYERITK